VTKEDEAGGVEFERPRWKAQERKNICIRKKGRRRNPGTGGTAQKRGEKGLYKTARRAPRGGRICLKIEIRKKGREIISVLAKRRNVAPLRRLAGVLRRMDRGRDSYEKRGF